MCNYRSKGGASIVLERLQLDLPEALQKNRRNVYLVLSLMDENNTQLSTDAVAPDSSVSWDLNIVFPQANFIVSVLESRWRADKLLVGITNSIMTRSYHLFLGPSEPRGHRNRQV